MYVPCALVAGSTNTASNVPKIRHHIMGVRCKKKQSYLVVYVLIWHIYSVYVFCAVFTCGRYTEPYHCQKVVGTMGMKKCKKCCPCQSVYYH